MEFGAMFCRRCPARVLACPDLAMPEEIRIVYVRNAWAVQEQWPPPEEGTEFGL